MGSNLAQNWQLSGAIMGALILFGIAYALLVHNLGARKDGYTWLLVVIGDAVTVLALCAEMQTIERVATEYIRRVSDPVISAGIQREVTRASQTARKIQRNTNDVINLLRDDDLI